MKEKLKEICRHTRKELAPLGLEVTGCHYYIPQLPQTSQNKVKGVFVCFDAKTYNQHFFGEQYNNRRRIKLLGLSYAAGEEMMSKAFPEHEIWLDTYVRLQKPYTQEEVPTFSGLNIDDGFVDVASDNDVYFVDINKAIASGEVERGSTIDRYCQRYGLKHILKHGDHIISPDSSSVEALETLCETNRIDSVLEIGSGVGICGVAAQRRGLTDFAFLDTNPKVCDYLKTNFPHKVIQMNAFDFDFWRNFDGDVVLTGLPYEHHPHFLARCGWGLSHSCNFAVFQSGCTAFFEFEHDWLSGKKAFHNWPWYKPEQTIAHYFPNYLEMALEWQTCIVATKQGQDLTLVKKEMERRGFTEIKYERIEI